MGITDTGIEPAPHIIDNAYVRTSKVLVNLASPITFICVLTLLVVRGNRPYFFLYECVDEAVLRTVTIMVLIKFGWQMMLGALEILYSKKIGIFRFQLGVFKLAVRQNSLVL